MKTPKANVLRQLPDAYCVQLSEGNGEISGHFIVWPGKIQPRGFEQPAIGIGKNRVAAWRDAEQSITARAQARAQRPERAQEGRAL